MEYNNQPRNFSNLYSFGPQSQASPYSNPAMQMPQIAMPTFGSPMDPMNPLSGGYTNQMDMLSDTATYGRLNGLVSEGGGFGSGFSMDGFYKFMSGAVGTKEAPGWGGMALGAVSGLGSAYLGMKQYGLAKQQLAEGKRQYDKNYANQKQLTNASLEDRQAGRVAAGQATSVADYMKKNGVA